MYILRCRKNESEINKYHVKLYSSPYCDTLSPYPSKLFVFPFADSYQAKEKPKNVFVVGLYTSLLRTMRLEPNFRSTKPPRRLVNATFCDNPTIPNEINQRRGLCQQPEELHEEDSLDECVRIFFDLREDYEMAPSPRLRTIMMLCELMSDLEVC